MFHGHYFVNFIIMFEVLLGSHMFGCYLTHRSRYVLRLGLTISVCLVIAFLLPPPSDFVYGSFLYLFLFFLGGASLYICCSESFWSILFCTVTGYTVHHLAYILNDLCSAVLSVHHFPISPAALYFCTMLPPYLLSFYFLTGDLRKYHKIQVDNKKMLVLSGITVLVDVFLGLLLASKTSPEIRPSYAIVFDPAVIVSCILILGMLFSLYTNKTLQSEIQIMQQLLNEQKKQYLLSRDSIQLINLKCHDLKYQIRKLRKNEQEVDRNVLLEIENSIGIYDSAIHTGNNALDVILTEKSLICEKENIRLTCMVDSEHFNFISPTDIYSLFGNALDNAIEAVCHIPDENFRNISLNIRRQNNFLAVRIENYYDGDLTFEDGLPLSIKEENGYHGFGMKSMRMIAEKYDGCLTVNIDGQFFSLNILFPFPSGASVSDDELI